MALLLKHAMTICKIIANITLAVFFCYAIKKHRIKTHDDTHGYHNHVVVLIRLMPHFSHYVCASFLSFMFIVHCV